MCIVRSACECAVVVVMESILCSLFFEHIRRDVGRLPLNTFIGKIVGP